MTRRLRRTASITRKVLAAGLGLSALCAPMAHASVGGAESATANVINWKLNMRAIVTCKVVRSHHYYCTVQVSDRDSNIYAGRARVVQHGKRYTVKWTVDI
jgi:spermidine/putrescine-binding protein